MISFSWSRRFLTKLLGSRCRPAVPCNTARHVALALETLECREVPATFNWITSVAGTYNWSSPTNWAGGLAPVAANLTGDDIVNLTAALAGPVTIVVDGNYTLTQLNIGDPSGAQTYTLASGGTGSGLNFAVNTLTASITKTNAGGGADNILAPINLSANLTIADYTSNDLNFGGNIAMNAQTLTVGGSGNVTIGGVISSTGPAGITKTGTGDLTLSNGNTYAGATTIQQGTVIAAANSALGSGSAPTTVASGASLGFSSNVDYTTPETINASGAGAGNSAYVGFTASTGYLVGATQQILNWTYSSGSTNLNYSNGFTSNTLQLNGGASISGTALELTDGVMEEARSAFFPTPVSVAGFTSTFQFTYGSNPIANGFTFCVQNTGSTSVGYAGGDLGYAGIGQDNVAVEFNLYSNVSQLGVDANGAIGQTVDLTSSGINFHTNPNDVFQATVAYNGVDTITVTITDVNTGATTGPLAFSERVPADYGGAGAIFNVSGTNTFAGPINMSANSMIASGSGTLNLSGNVSLNTYGLTVGGAGSVALSGVISGTAPVGLTKTDSGTLTLSNSNTYTGTTSIEQGDVIAAANSSLGSGTSTVTVAPGAHLSFASNVDYTTAQPVTVGQTATAYVGFTGATGNAGATQDILNWTYASGATNFDYSSGFVSNPFVLNGGAVVPIVALQLTDGNANEASSAFVPAPVSVAGFASTFQFTYGAARAAGGFTFAIQNNGPTAVGGSGAQLGFGGILDSLGIEFGIDNNVSQIGVGTNGAIALTTDLTADGIDFQAHPTDVYQATVISNGAGVISVTVTDTTSHATTGALIFSDAIPVNPVNGGGVIENVGGSNSFAGPITLLGNSIIQSDAGALTLGGNVALNNTGLTVTGAGAAVISGVISGSGAVGVTKSGTGSLTLSNSNTYAGLTSIQQGAVIAVANGALGSGAADTDVAAGATLAFASNVTYTTAQPVSVGGTIENLGGVNSFAGPITLSGNSTIQSDAGVLALDGNIALNGYGLTVAGAGATVIGGVISSSGGVSADGPGTLTLANSEAFTGPTIVNAGYLQVDGSLSSSSGVSVAAGAALGGNGTVGAATVNGSLAPGGPSQLTATALSFGPASYFDAALDGSVPGTGPGGIVVTGSNGVDLSNAPTLIVSSNFTPPAGAQYTIIAEQGGGSTTGAFNGLPEGSSVTVGSQSFTITYVGGTSGQDVVLTAQGTPAVTTTPPSNEAVAAGSTATFTVAASDPTSTVQWLVSADGGLTFTPMPGATSTTLTINNVALADNGDLYEALFTNSSGVAITNPAALTVIPPPLMTIQPANQTATAGGNAVFIASASGNPTPSVQWQVSTNGGVTFTPVSGATATTLTLTGVSVSQSGYLYEAVFTNPAGSVTSNAASLIVNTLPVTTTTPASQTITAGGNVTFTAAATGDPTPTVQWEVSVNGGVTFMPIVGAVSTNLVLNGVPASDDGNEYEAVFTNAAGSVASAAATLTVQYAPVVTGQPSSQTVTGGASVAFMAAASGDPSPTVQWEVSADGGLTFSPISGATSTTLVVAGVTSAYNGYEYEAVFTNSLGAAASNPAVLTFPAPTDILQYRDNDQSTGVNPSEYTLTPANVTPGSFGKLFTTPVDGQVYAQPLVDTGITITDGPHTTTGAAGVHNVVYVATENDTLYAIDATIGAILWERSFLTVSDPDNNTLGATAIAPQDAADTLTADISPNIGITGTPVIDNSTNTLYVVVATMETIGGNTYFVQRLHAVNLSDGTDQVTPYLIGSTTNGNDNNTQIYAYGGGGAGAVVDPYNGTGQNVVQFNALRENERAALSLVNGDVYVAWASHGDNGPYHGWIVKWNVANLLTSGFVLAGVFCTSPNDGEAGIWNGGGQLTFEPDGSALYFSTGNGYGGVPTVNAQGFPSDANYNEAVVKLTNDPTTTGGANQNANGWGFKVVDWFIPYNVDALDDADDDLGSGAIVLLPPSAGVPGHPNLLIAGGKEGALYVLDRDNLGHFNPTSDAALNSVPNGDGDTTPAEVVNGLLSTPTYFDGYIYAMSGYDGALYQFQLSSTGMLIPVSQSAVTNFGYNPGSPTVSADGTSNGIVWVYDRQANELHAYAATSLSTEIWNSDDDPSGGDSLGAAVKFAAPVVANGEVFAATTDSLVVYGLFSPPTDVPQAPLLAGTASGGLAVDLTWTDPTQIPNTAAGYTIEESTDGINFRPVATAVAGANTVSVGGLQPLTQYYFEITGYNSLGASSPSNIVTVATSYLTPAVNFSGGFANASAQMALNGSTQFNGSRLELTNRNSSAAGSAFYATPVDVTGFTTQFTFQLSAGTGNGAGFTFTIQGAGPAALGSNGAGLGYAGITPSVAVKFDLFNDNGEGVDSTGLFSGGAPPTNTGSIDLTQSGVNLHSGDIMSVYMTYDGTTLTVTITDTVTGQTATQSYAVNIPSLVGGNVGYVGFTAGTEGAPTVQDILTWAYAPDAAVSPNPPVGLAAIPVTATSIQLTWTNPAGNNQIGYYLVRATDPNFTDNVVTQNLPATPSSFTDTANGLAPGTTYYYKLQAYNSAGSSSFSNVVTVPIPDAPAKPTMQEATGVSTTEIDLTWQDNAGHAATGYEILESVNFGTFFTAALLPPTSRTPPDDYGWSATNLTPGAYYEFHIIAFNSSGNTDFAGLNATTLTVPPSDLTATAGSGVINLSWTAPSGAATFNIYRGTSPGNEGATPLYTGVTTTSFVDTTVTSGTTYYYTVTSVNLNSTYQPPLPAESADSNEASADWVDAVTTQPVNQTVNAGQTATFTAATNDPADTVEWQVNSGSGFTNLTDSGAYRGSATTTLTIGGASAAMSGYQYQAVFTSSAGILTSSTATLTISTPPAVTMQPVNQTVNAGQTATFTVAASGTPAPAVQWLVSTDGGASWTNIAGATSTTLTLSNVAAMQNGNEYEAIFTTSAGTAATNPALLTIDYVAVQPGNRTVNAGQNMTFTAVSSNPRGADTLQWQVNTGSGFTNLTDGGVYSGSATTTLTITGASAAMSGYQYQAVFTNSAGSLTTNAATLTVNAPPAVTMQPVNQTVNAGQTATFTVAAGGAPTPAVQWLVSMDGGASWTNIAGATSTTLTLSNVAAMQNGNEYEAIFTSSAGTAATNPALLTIDYVAVQPGNRTVNAGQNITFTAASSNPNGADTPHWQVNTGSGFTNLTDGGVYSGSATTTLTITGASAAMSGYQYDAVFTNGAGSLTTNAVTLAVNVPPGLAGLPVVNGSNAVINIVSASGDGATATITTDGTAHGFWVGELVTLTGVTPGGPGGLAETVTVTGVPSATSFQFGSTYAGSETLSGATVRAALAGAQRSMVDSIVYSFTEPVNLTATAFSISVIANNTTTGSEVGVAPTLNVAPVPFTNQWVVTFTDPVNGSVIGNSIANGGYSISINPALVTAVSGGQNLSAGETDTFYRLYGDLTGAQSVTNVDANAFNRTWGNSAYSAGYIAALDYNDDGKFSNADANAFNRVFNTRYNLATTI